MEWLTSHKIPLGIWADDFILFIEDNFATVLDYVTDNLRFVMEGLTDVLLWVNPFVLMVLVAAFAFWLHRSIILALGIILSLLLVANLGYWEALIQTFALIIFATTVCMAVGVPLGVAAAHRPWLYTALRPVLDLMQTIPTFVYLIPTLVLFGLGLVPGLISTVIFAIPAPIRLTYLGISSVPDPLKEAAESFGATKRQLLWKVEFPYAMPTIMAGLTQCIMLSLSMVVIAALVGADGLGKPVVQALNTVNIPKGVESGICIVILAILLDRICKQRSAEKKED
ncbi:MAG: choline ABC transporter permease subunit [Alphaproteobacteria bacterium]|nr:choline ABC transporter permease subunit [Alphaproteobacteria bacterium]